MNITDILWKILLVFVWFPLTTRERRRKKKESVKIRFCEKRPIYLRRKKKKKKKHKIMFKTSSDYTINNQTILKEHIDEHYEPTDEEIREYALYIGIDPDKVNSSINY